VRDGNAEIAPDLGLVQHTVGRACGLGGVFVGFKRAHRAGEARFAMMAQVADAGQIIDVDDVVVSMLLT